MLVSRVGCQLGESDTRESLPDRCRTQTLELIPDAKSFPRQSSADSGRDLSVGVVLLN